MAGDWALIVVARRSEAEINYASSVSLFVRAAFDATPQCWFKSDVSEIPLRGHSGCFLKKQVYYREMPRIWHRILDTEKVVSGRPWW